MTAAVARPRARRQPGPVSVGDAPPHQSPDDAAPAGVPAKAAPPPEEGAGGVGAPAATDPFTRYQRTNSASSDEAEEICDTHVEAEAPGLALSPEQEWFREVERLTSPYRRRKAGRYRLRARLLERAHEYESAVWFTARAFGQRHRFERVERCGARVRVVLCPYCHDKHEHPAHCSTWKLCVPCRGRRSRAYRDRLRETLPEIERRMGQLGLASRSLGDARCGPKFLTLTMPHVDAKRDARSIVNAFARFKRKLLRYLERERQIERPSRLPHLRVVEVTPGRARDGHWHIHAWWFGPYLPQPLLAWLWSESLDVEHRRRCPLRLTSTVIEREKSARWRMHCLSMIRSRRGRRGRALRWMREPITHIKAADAATVAEELVKYLVKDCGPDGEKVDARLFADLFEGLEGVRSVQPSRGFWLPVATWVCQACGCGERPKVYIEREQRRDPSVRGPPFFSSSRDDTSGAAQGAVAAEVAQMLGKMRPP